LWLGLGIAEQLLDHRQESVSALLRSADADPDFLPPLALLAELSILSDQAKADLRRRIAHYMVAHPDNADAHFAYAHVLSKQAQPEENGTARQEIASHLKRALALNPQMARAHFLLGDIETNANNLSGAMDEFVHGLKLDPGNAQAHYRLALLYRRNGQQESARREMEAFQELHGKPGDENSASATGTTSFTMPSIQPVSAQRGCGLKPE
jgi:tetratricopeptide (TPR) repeat protein